MNNELNVFAPKNEVGTSGAASAMMMNRQAQEVQAAMIVAKRFPRDEKASADRILAACTRKSLAEAAMYEYTKGGSVITGPSIRLAEAMAQAWGNIDFGIIELEQKSKESQVMAYAWDLETNTRQSKIFTVPHVRVSTKGSKMLTDPRDIYEMVANQGARRLRACILGVIPGDVSDMAVKQCEITLRSGNEPLENRIESMVKSFEELNISRDMLAGFIGKNVEAFSVNDVVRLGKVYRSIKDGVVGSDYFTSKLAESAQERKKELPEGNSVKSPEVVEEEQVNLNGL